MSVSEVHGVTSETSVDRVAMKLEIQVIPVSDVDRAKGFYERLGWRFDDDAAPLDGLRIVQFTPPGSGTSVTFGTGLTSAAPGSAEGGLTVSDIEAAHDGLLAGGIDVSDVWHGPPFPPRPGNPAPTPSAPATSLSSPSMIPTATRGSSRRSPRASQGGSIPWNRRSRQRQPWKARFGEPRPPTSSTRSGQGGRTYFTGRVKTTTGPPGMPPTWWRSRAGAISRPDRSRPLPGGPIIDLADENTSLLIHGPGELGAPNQNRRAGDSPHLKGKHHGIPGRVSHQRPGGHLSGRGCGPGAGRGGRRGPAGRRRSSGTGLEADCWNRREQRAWPVPSRQHDRAARLARGTTAVRVDEHHRHPAGAPSQRPSIYAATRWQKGTLCGRPAARAAADAGLPIGGDPWPTARPGSDRQRPPPHRAPDRWDLHRPRDLRKATPRS